MKSEANVFHRQSYLSLNVDLWMGSQYFQQTVVPQSTGNHERSVPLQVLAVDVSTSIQ